MGRESEETVWIIRLGRAPVCRGLPSELLSNWEQPPAHQKWMLSRNNRHRYFSVMKPLWHWNQWKWHCICSLSILLFWLAAFLAYLIQRHASWDPDVWLFICYDERRTLCIPLSFISYIANPSIDSVSNMSMIRHGVYTLRHWQFITLVWRHVISSLNPTYR